MLKYGEQRIPTQDQQSALINFIEDRGPIDLDVIDYTMNNSSEEVRRRAGPVLEHFFETEATVPRYEKEVLALLPSAPDETKRFANRWRIEEGFHAKPFAKIIEMSGGEVPIIDEDNVNKSMIWGGYIGEHSQAFHDMSEYGFYFQGATQESWTIAGYRAVASLLSEVISPGFVKTAIRQIMKQEPTHAGWYEGEALRKASTMHPYQIFTVRNTVKHVFNTVGTDTLAKKRRFALVTRMLLNHELGINLQGPAEQSPVVSEADLSKFIAPIQRNGDILLHAKTRQTKLLTVRNKIAEAVSRGDWAPAITEFVGKKHSDTPKPGDFMLKRLLKQQAEWDDYQRSLGIAT